MARIENIFSDLRGDDYFLRGTFAPFLRASERPIAIACLRLFTVLPLLPDFNVPRFCLRTADLTVALAFAPYRAMNASQEVGARYMPVSPV